MEVDPSHKTLVPDSSLESSPLHQSDPQHKLEHRILLAPRLYPDFIFLIESMEFL